MIHKTVLICSILVIALTLSCGKSGENSKNTGNDSIIRDTTPYHPIPHAFMYGKIKDASPPWVWGNTGDTTNYDASDMGYALVGEFKSIRPNTVLSFVESDIITPDEQVIAQNDSSVLWSHHYYGSTSAEKLSCNMYLKCVSIREGCRVRVSNEDLMALNEGVLDGIRTGVR
jgi:hypothetical protein